MLREYMNIVLDLWMKAEFQELEYSEIFGMFGIAVSSAVLALFLKFELASDSKGSDDTMEEKTDEKEEHDNRARLTRQHKVRSADTSSELINLLSKIALKSKQQPPPLDDHDFDAIVNQSSLCAALLRTPQQKQSKKINDEEENLICRYVEDDKSVKRSKKQNAGENEVNLNPPMKDFLEKVLKVPKGSNSVFSEDQLKKIIFEIHQTSMMSYEEQYAQKCISLLLMCPSAVNVPRHPYGFTPFLSACWAGSLTLIRFMLQNGADVRDRTVDGDTPMYLAVRATIDTNQVNPSLELLSTLYDAGCDVNCSNRAGFTPLHLAATCGRLQITKWLLEHGASPNPRTFNGHQALELAKTEGHIHLIPLIEAAEKEHMRRKCTSRQGAVTPDKTVLRDSCSSFTSAEDSCCSDQE